MNALTPTQIDLLPAQIVDARERIWTKDVDPMNGCISWCRGEAQIFATPGWEGDDGIAVQFDIEEGEPVAFTLALPFWDQDLYVGRVAQLLAKFA